MAKAEYIISLIKSHYNNEPERFTTVALQIAAHEAKLGHTIVADEIKTIIDKAKETKLHQGITGCCQFRLTNFVCV